MPSAPLAHLRVVDLTDLRGALTGRLLADLGADVLKVEPPGGDPDRRRPPFTGPTGEAEHSLAFLYRHANKRGCKVDLTTDTGRRRLEVLCAAADVLVENLSPDERAQVGLDVAGVQVRHPHLVHVVMADFGLTGPRSRWRLEALPAFAASTALHASGFPDLPPCGLPGHPAHDCAAAFACAGALTALLDRARTGLGQTVEVSVQEAALAGLAPWAIPLPDYHRLYPVIPAVQSRNADGNYLVVPVADGWVRFLPATARHWRAFTRLLGEPEALAGAHWEAIVHRILNADVIRLVASECLASRERAEVVRTGLSMGVPIAPVATPADFVASEQETARGYFRRPDFPVVGDAPFAVAPFVFSETPVVLCRPAPRLADDESPWPAARRPTPPHAPAGAVPPLAGVRVLALAVVAVGPEVCWLLSELGAEVIKIESRVKLDPLREVAIDPGQPNRAFTFNAENRGQKSVCLDLRTARGRELALTLAATCNVVVENNRGGVAASWGLDYEDVRRVRPDVVYLASQAHGRGGPLGTVQGFGPLNAAFAGVHWLWNHPAAPYPAGASLNHPDHLASKLGLVAVLAALEHRRRTGQGQLVDLSQTEVAAFVLGEAYLEGPLTGTPATPRGNRVPWASPHGVYPCAGDDRWVAVAVVGDEPWQRLRAHLGWPDEPALRRLAGRVATADELDEWLADWTRPRAAPDVADELQRIGVSAMPVVHGEDLRADPHLAARGAIVTMHHPEVGAERHAGNPLRFTRIPLVPAGPSPLLGADTVAVLREVLGLSADEVDELERGGVCR
jgi:crotonobetainyl-CoA:carnitine CoA-transferase CaiB-like acyl-CoA transferase